MDTKYKTYAILLTLFMSLCTVIGIGVLTYAISNQLLVSIGVTMTVGPSVVLLILLVVDTLL